MPRQNAKNATCKQEKAERNVAKSYNYVGATSTQKSVAITPLRKSATKQRCAGQLIRYLLDKIRVGNYNYTTEFLGGTVWQLRWTNW